jgi:hydroxymethylbilane synthase
MNRNPQARRLRVGTRGSPLALAQAAAVRNALAMRHHLGKSEIETRIIKTTGDKIQDRPLADIGGKGLFTKEIEAALLDGEIDLAVHSAKDMPTELPKGLIIAAYLEREDVRDVLMSGDGGTLQSLAAGARIGTASLRREAQVRHLRPDLNVLPLRGNIHTRLRKVETGAVEAIILGLAGLTRLALPLKGARVLSVEDFLPAVGQGAIAIEARGNDEETCALLAAINHWPTDVAVTAERAFLAELGGSCRTPIAGYAVVRGCDLQLRGMMLRPDGGWCCVERVGDVADPEQLGCDAGSDLRRHVSTALALEAT